MIVEPIIYSAPWCVYCNTLKKQLDYLAVTYDDKNVDDPDIRKEMNNRTNNNQTIPVLLIGDKFWVNPDFKILKQQFGDR